MEACSRPIFSGRLSTWHITTNHGAFYCFYRTTRLFLWFQQDGAIARTATEMITLLCEFFGDRLISHPNWLPRSLDMTPDFFLWGMSKTRFSTIPQTQWMSSSCVLRKLSMLLSRKLWGRSSVICRRECQRVCGNKAAILSIWSNPASKVRLFFETCFFCTIGSLESSGATVYAYFCAAVVLQ